MTARSFDCAACGRRIGVRAYHYLIGDWTDPAERSADRILCGRCIGSTRELHPRYFPECPYDWHDLHDHPGGSGRRSGVAAVLERAD